MRAWILISVLLLIDAAFPEYHLGHEAEQIVLAGLSVGFILDVIEVFN